VSPRDRRRRRAHLHVVWRNPRDIPRRPRGAPRQRRPSAAESVEREANARAYGVRQALKGSTLRMAIATLGAVSARALADVSDDEFERWLAAVGSAREDARRTP
jgi:hypothetical protein